MLLIRMLLFTKFGILHHFFSNTFLYKIQNITSFLYKIQKNNIISLRIKKYNTIRNITQFLYKIQYTPFCTKYYTISLRNPKYCFYEIQNINTISLRSTKYKSYNICVVMYLQRCVDNQYGELLYQFLLRVCDFYDPGLHGR
jgi:hypothetical protein